MSPEITTESSARLMDNGDGTTIDAVLMQSDRDMMGVPEATPSSSEPESNQDNQPGLTTSVVAAAVNWSRPHMKKTGSIRQN